MSDLVKDLGGDYVCPTCGLRGVHDGYETGFKLHVAKDHEHDGSIHRERVRCSNGHTFLSGAALEPICKVEGCEG